MDAAEAREYLAWAAVHAESDTGGKGWVADFEARAAEAMAALVAEEREACAKVAEDPNLRSQDTDDTMEAIAAAIRARGNP